MRRYWRSLRRFWGTAFATQLEYQANVMIELVAVALSLSGSLLLLSLLFGPGRALGGWTWHQALVVQGFYTVFDGMATTWLRPNLGSIGAYQQSCPLGALCRGATFEVTAISGGTAMSVGP
jgi:ABC-2 type transport system permease protein